MSKVTILTHNGQWLHASKDENQVYYYLLDHQSSSTDWAIKYEGYKIEEVDEKKTFYILDPHNFTGSVLNTMNAAGMVHNLETPMYYKEYLKQLKGNFIAVDFNTLCADYLTPYYNSRVTPFKEITEDRYFYMLEVLPPMKWHDFKEINIFFISEATTGTLHSCFVKYAGRYYEALKDIYSKDEDIYKEIKNL